MNFRIYPRISGWLKAYRRAWLPALFLLAGVAAWGFWGQRPPPPPPPAPVAKNPQMEGLALTEIQEGDKRWVLEAKKADFLQERLEIRITGVKVEFFGPGEHILVKADEGLFHTKTRVLTLKGRVEMRRGDMLIQTDLAIYQPATRLLVAPEEVTLTEPRLTVQGKNLTVHLADKKLVLAQHTVTEVKAQAWELAK
jgi:LPS export ABC transporter protein LptC